MKSDRLPVAILGGGYSGTIVGAELARRGIAAMLVDPGRHGLGAAYSTHDPAHLLNVRAGNMSAWADDPGDFERFLADRGGDAGGFARRMDYGAYLQSILAEAEATGSLVRVDGRAVAASPAGEGWQVSVTGGDTVDASAVVLATGNQAPEPLPAFAGTGARYLNNPWADQARIALAAAAQGDRPVLLVGTGLTMVDMVLSLSDLGYRGRIVAVSRRGLIPRAHAEPGPAVAAPNSHDANLIAMLRWLRRTGAEAGWRSAVDSLRPVTQQLWRELGPAQQRRFLRHARPWWDVHRHRIAPEVATRLRDLVAEGRLEVVAGRIAEARTAADGLDVTIRRRSCGEELLRVAYAFNCTGPLGAIGRTPDPLLRQLLADGHAAPDALGMGLEVDDRSRLPGARRLWALGPLTKGEFWEIVAVPDIRLQARQVADDIAQELGA